jgi:Domain of unknown function (DUF4783)
MNRFVLIALLMTLLLTQPGVAGPPAELPDGIRVSLLTGQAHGLATHFDKTIELVIDSEAINFTTVRAGQAELILNTFFKKHPPLKFQYLYLGQSSRLKYGTGTYQSGGQMFSVYMLLRRTTTNEYVINTLQFRQTA